MFATASTSHFETFGRAPAEALACGTQAIAPRYDGFAEVLAQAGGRLVDIEIDAGVPRVNEAAFLRAVYEALSFPSAATNGEIAAVAQHRFCRSRSLRLLDYLADTTPAVPHESAEIPGIDVEIPSDWSAAMGRMRAMPSRDALLNLWSWREQRRLSHLNETFRMAIRNALASAALPPRPANQPCL